ncbi:hypothetical protein ACFOHK_19640 [Falsigemmobacter intermedius]|uniref:Uncharacterized protein n=1 Tax=Falsigemmobacter intermedius TaxID=1553448 RepID=A0A3S3WF34_9RHOB|nr:hypothetical protein [Falsigemmobacter intermedius]RWY37332.1 hypothetical protein EP867_17415 [Falsigemmobacter intermedius]
MQDIRDFALKRVRDTNAQSQALENDCKRGAEYLGSSTPRALECLITLIPMGSEQKQGFRVRLTAIDKLLCHNREGAWWCEFKQSIELLGNNGQVVDPALFVGQRLAGLAEASVERVRFIGVPGNWTVVWGGD